MSDEVYLIQTDTTVGFLSSDYKKLNQIKNRPKDQPVLITTAYFRVLKKLVRVPKRFKKEIRRTKKTTYIYPNKKAVRVVKDDPHEDFLKKFDFLYSTSANKTSKKFDLNYAYLVADIIVEDKRGFFEKSPSKIYVLSKNIKKKLR